MKKITILGSANAIAKRDQQNTHLLFETKEHKVMVDCGDNPVSSLAKAGVGITQITDLILTHFHADHVGSLPLLLMDMWLEHRTEPLTIYGLDITLHKANQLLELFDWKNWKGMFEVNFKPMSQDCTGMELFINDGELTLFALPVIHLIPTIGLRFEFSDDSKIAYSCDTEPCKSIEKLADRADILLQEAAGPGKGHTSPLQAGEIAAKCKVNRLVLIHYDQRRSAEDMVNEAKASYAGSVELAYDGMEL